MTTQTTTITTNTTGMRTLIGAAAAGLAVLGGALLWQVRPASEATVPAASTSIGAVNEGVAALGGLSEQYRDEATAQAEREAARLTTRGGMAELYAERGTPLAATEPVTTWGGLAERYAEAQAAARAEVSRLERMGGMAELHREQAAAATSAR